MMKKLLIVACLLFSLAVPATASAYDVVPKDACQGAAKDAAACQQSNSESCKDGSSGKDCTNDSNPALSLIKKITTLVAVAAGIAAVILIIVAGLRFITSGGNEQKVAAARGTLMNVIIGLAIIALASTIVSFVIGKL